MPNIKKLSSTIFYLAIFIAVVLFTYDFTTRHFSNVKFIHQNIVESDAQVDNSELLLLQETVKLHEAKITELQSLVENLNKNAANSERYSKFFLIASNIEKLMKGEESVDISFDIKGLQTFAVNDAQLLKIVGDISEVQSVYGEKYFELKFSKVVRSIMRQYYENAQDHPLVSYLKSHIMPYFAYITPEGNHTSYVLYQAHQRLEAGNMAEVYNLMLGISNDSVHFKDFMEKLEKHVRVSAAMEKSRKHVEMMLVESKNAN
jgi:hypothetical protein